MPGRSQTSVTVPQKLYDSYKKGFEMRKAGLARKGITSHTRYITRTLEEGMEREETFARHRPVLQGIGSDEEWGKIWIKDNKVDRIASVTVGADGLKCDVDDDGDDCVHVGFAYSLPETYRMMEKLGVKLPTARGEREQIRRRVPPSREVGNQRRNINGGRET